MGRGRRGRGRGRGRRGRKRTYLKENKEEDTCNEKRAKIEEEPQEDKAIPNNDDNVLNESSISVHPSTETKCDVNNIEKNVTVETPIPDGSMANDTSTDNASNGKTNSMNPEDNGKTFDRNVEEERSLSTDNITIEHNTFTLGKQLIEDGGSFKINMCAGEDNDNLKDSFLGNNIACHSGIYSTGGDDNTKIFAEEQMSSDNIVEDISDSAQSLINGDDIEKNVGVEESFTHNNSVGEHGGTTSGSQPKMICGIRVKDIQELMGGWNNIVDDATATTPGSQPKKYCGLRVKDLAELTDGGCANSAAEHDATIYGSELKHYYGLRGNVDIELPISSMYLNVAYDNFDFIQASEMPVKNRNDSVLSGLNVGKSTNNENSAFDSRSEADIGNTTSIDVFQDNFEDNCNTFSTTNNAYNAYNESCVEEALINLDICYDNKGCTKYQNDLNRLLTFPDNFFYHQKIKAAQNGFVYFGASRIVCIFCRVRTSLAEINENINVEHKSGYPCTFKKPDKNDEDDPSKINYQVIQQYNNDLKNAGRIGIYSVEAYRIITFLVSKYLLPWPLKKFGRCLSGALELANAGFFRLDNHRVRCCGCGATISNASILAIQRIKLLHYQNANKCPFLNGSLKGVPLGSELFSLFPNKYIGDETCIYVPGGKQPEFGKKETRLKTFNAFRNITEKKANDLSTAGFFYNGQKIFCFYCLTNLNDWIYDCDDTWIQHVCNNTECAYVIKNRGKDFIKTALNKAQALASRPNHKVTAFEFGSKKYVNVRDFDFA